MPEEPKPQQVQIKADEKELLGQYSNLVMVHHNAEEFTLNFVYVFPECPTRQTSSQPYPKPGPPEALSPRPQRQHHRLRSAIRPHQRKSGTNSANHGRFRPVIRLRFRCHPEPTLGVRDLHLKLQLPFA